MSKILERYKNGNYEVTIEEDVRLPVAGITGGL